MQIAVLLFDRVTALEAVVPYEILSRIPSAQVTFVGERIGPVRTDTGRLALTADAVHAEVPSPDVLVVPGGPGARRHLANGPLHQWLRAAALTARWVVGVGSGTLILAASGVLRGRSAAAECEDLAAELTALGAHPVAVPFTVDGTVASASGSASCISLSLRLAADLGGGTGPADVLAGRAARALTSPATPTKGHDA